MGLAVSTGNEAVSIAKQWIGTPYCWGGGHNGAAPVGSICVDCSGLVNQVFGTQGNTFSQVMMGQSVGSINDAGPGDLIFFGPIAPGEPHHVGIYTGSGQMIDAPTTGTLVRQESINGFGPIYDIRRLVPAGGGDPSSQGSNAVTLTYAQLEGLWIQAGGNQQAAPMAAAIAMAESGGYSAGINTNTDNSVDRGLWQINSSHGTQSTFDIMGNARAAIAISNNGSNWRPWCTAYSDAGCGTHGGCYQCPGSPYLQFFDPTVTPDFNFPINATNAAANQGGSTDAIEVSSVTDCLQNPFGCESRVGSNFGLPGLGLVDPVKMSASIIKAVMLGVINPMIQPIAGIMGIAAGGTLVLGGIYLLVSGTKVGQSVGGAARMGAIAIAPETGAVLGRTGGERTAWISRGTQSRAQTAREGQARQEFNQRRVAGAERHAQRMEAATTQEQLRRETLAYAEWLRRTRPPPRRNPRGPGMRPPGRPSPTPTPPRG